MRRLLLVLAALAAVAGCSTTTVAGSPAPAPAAAAAQSGEVALPARPREIPLDGVDACSLLTPEQRTALGLTEDSQPFTGTAPGFEGPACAMQGFEPRAITVGLVLSVENSISVLTAPGSGRDQLTPITVAGFPAVLARPRITDFCAVDVDIAEGQFLDIQLADGGGNPPVSQDELCRDVVPLAEQVLLTLQNRG